jgi:dephospho-CoA kinase
MKEKNNILVAITGNLCSGKSSVLEIIKTMNYPVFSFDKETELLLSNDKNIISSIKEIFPEAVNNGSVNKKILGDIVFFNQDLLLRLEKILKPKLYENRSKFIKELKNKDIAFFEVPLLFEKGTEKMYDRIILLTVSDIVQKQRVKQRKIPIEKAKKIMELQVSSNDVKQRADYIIDTDLDLANIREKVKKIINKLESEF